MPSHYDLCLAWNWEYDEWFTRLLQAACDARGLSLVQITPDNLEAMLFELTGNHMSFGNYYDRASDSDERFLALAEWAYAHKIHMINPTRIAQRAWNKVKMYEQFQSVGLLMPATIILPPYQDQPELLPFDLSYLGASIAIKPAHGGGGIGVYVEATSWKQIHKARQEYPDDQYLLQSHVVPAQLAGRPAWFRVIYLGEQIFPCWWQPDSHVYTPVSESDETSLSLQPLRSITRVISQICQLDLFSTEIARTSQGQFLVIDYVNDPIDLRLQSQAADGLPDEIIQAIAAGLANLVAPQKR
jgi:hypothetical protein